MNESAELKYAGAYSQQQSGTEQTGTVTGTAKAQWETAQTWMVWMFIDWIGMKATKLKERESAHESVNAHGTLRASGKKAKDGWRRARRRTEGEEALRQMIKT